MTIYQFLEDNRIEYKQDVALSSLTGMNIEGSLPILAKPDSISKLSLLYEFLVDSDLSYDIIGALTNTYLCASYCPDIVVQTTKVKDKCEGKGMITLGCGYSLTKIAKELCASGVRGYEGFVGIPGTIGAAAINNSGAFTSVMSEVVRYVDIMGKDGNARTISNQDMNYKTRDSILKKTDFGILLSVTLDVSKIGDVNTISQTVNEYCSIRKRDIDGNRKSLGSIITGDTVPLLWNEHKVANFLRKLIYAPFKYTSIRKKAQCFSEFLVLGGLRFVRHCDNIGRFCWTNNTTEDVFMDYISFITKQSNNKIKLEIEIKK